MAELKRCRLEGTQETIPTLEEVLELFQGGPPPSGGAEGGLL